MFREGQSVKVDGLDGQVRWVGEDVMEIALASGAIVLERRPHGGWAEAEEGVDGGWKDREVEAQSGWSATKIGYDVALRTDEEEAGELLSLLDTVLQGKMRSEIPAEAIKSFEALKAALDRVIS